MTAKEKAIELFNKFKLEPIKPICIMHPQHWKQCALICVDEILTLGKKIPLEILEYYLEVKKEIEKL